jgi:predicted nucleotidyltransferase component of viral defense system
MEYQMMLHLDFNLYSTLLRAAAQQLDIKLEFVEKDYWISLVLSRLAKSAYVNACVFKGGTSLSKGYRLLDRFSEDIDLAILSDKVKSGNEIKSLIRTIEKEITLDLKEIQVDAVTSKGSRFRKSVFEYVPAEKDTNSNTLIVEINAFANPYPFQPLTLQSMVFDFLQQTANDKYIDLYALHPFEVNVLSKEQTLLEKLAALVRFSFTENAAESISGKIRHFYDLYYLMNDAVCIEFAASPSFKEQFDAILQHDRGLFDEPIGWESKSISESRLLLDFSALWKQLIPKYETELAAFAFRPIPNEKDVAKCVEDLITRIA